ncbi:MAG: glycosyltransferase [Chloroherpetonaceae bacterium]
MLLSIVIPAYNEEKRIGASLHELQAFLPNHFEQTEVIVVNDGSVFVSFASCRLCLASR